MKKIILAAFILLSITTFGQTTYADQAGKWRLGLNAGAMWQTCDVTAHAGIAGGFTIERILNKKADALVGFSLGLRYLSGNCTGLDTKPSYGVANNNALNGTFDTTLNYAKHGGVFYNNYKTYIHEGALELKINFPRFEQKTNLIFHIMGGVGICNYKTWINATDVNGNMYDFTALQNVNNVTAADVKKVLNGSYGTLAQGSSASGTTTFVPSVGVGFGFKLSKHAALVFEYRASFPGTNLLDGVTYNANNEPTKGNDFYNYASANLLFTIFGRQTHSEYNNPPTNNTGNYNPAPQPIYNNTPPPTNNTNIYNNTTVVPPVNNTPIYNSPPQQPVYPPYVNITYPANNYSSPSNYISVQGTIQNIQSANQVSISQNGYPIHYFSYDPYSGNFHFQTFLQQGTNNIIVTANSAYGTGSQGVTIFYNPPYVPNNGGNNYPTNPPNNVNPGNNPNTGTTPVTPTVTTNPVLPHINGNVPIIFENKPIVQYVNPSMSPEEVSNSTYNVSATIQNINLANQITVSVNGNNVQQFNFNASTKMLTFTANLLTGYNSVHISATNTAGTDAKSTVIDYKPTGKPPRIDIFNPATSPFTSQQQNVIVSGYVYNISSSSDITVTFNGNPLSFNYNNNTHEIDIPVNLFHNSNQLNISANNTFGNDAKQITLLLINTIHSNPNIGPIITPTVQTQPTFTVHPHLGGDVVITPTVQPQPTFTINPHTNNIGTEVDPLNGGGGNTGGNTNTGGGSHNGGAMHHQPEITRTSPAASPYTTMSGVISISANVNFVLAASSVSVIYNGNLVSFSYNPQVSEQLNFTSPLKPGMNTFTIKASNPFGSSTQDVDINYVPTNPNGNVNGNPGLHFTGGMNNATNPSRGFNTNVQPNIAPQQPVKPIQQPNTGGRPIFKQR